MTEIEPFDGRRPLVFRAYRPANPVLQGAVDATAEELATAPAPPPPMPFHAAVKLAADTDGEPHRASADTARAIAAATERADKETRAAVDVLAQLPK